MDRKTRLLLYPEGDSVEIEHDLAVNQLVDLNGLPLRLPLATAKMIAYRVYRKSTRIERHEEIISYHVELVPAAELVAFTREVSGP